MENAKLSGWQMFCLTFCFGIGTTFILLPGKLIADAKQYSILVSVCALLYGVVLACLWLFLSQRFPGRSLVQIIVQVLGKWVGGLMAFFYIFYFIQIASWITRNLSDYMHINLMPRTPVIVFIILLLLVCAYSVVKGIESIAMASEIITLYGFVAFWIPFSMMLREWDWDNFLIAERFNTWNIFAKTSYAFAFPYMEMVALMMVIPFVSQKRVTAFLTGILWAGINLTICILFTVGILGVERSSHLIYPVYIIFREMTFSRLFEHLEAIISVNILLFVFIKLSILFYCAVLAMCQLFNVKRRAVVAYPLIWVISAYSMLFANVVDNIEWVQKYLFSYYTVYAIAIPIVLIMVSWFKPKGYKIQ